MMSMCTSKFEVEEQQRVMLNKYLSNEEIQATREEKVLTLDRFDPISDNEEDDSSTAQDQTTPEPLSGSGPTPSLSHIY